MDVPSRQSTEEKTLLQKTDLTPRTAQPTLRFTYPSELGYHPDTGAFNGRLLVWDDAPRIATRIRRLVQEEDGRTSRVAEVESVEGFRLGDAVRVMLLQAGDQLQWPQHAVLTRDCDEPKSWTLSSSSDEASFQLSD